MRRASSNYGFMLDESGQLLGLNLGFDHCAEHERGAQDLMVQMGLDPDKPALGLEDRKIRVVPENLRFIQYKELQQDKRLRAVSVAVLICDERQAERPEAEQIEWVTHHPELQLYAFVPNSVFYNPARDNLATAWDESSFAIKVRGEDNILRLQRMYEAFQAKDILIAPPWGESFRRGGLALVLDSKIPEDDRDAVLARDLDAKALRDAVQATGIEEYLRSKGKRWFALKPAWANAEKTEIKFFLNPMEQTKHNYGWYDLPALRQWGENTGPVMM